MGWLTMTSSKPIDKVEFLAYRLFIKPVKIKCGMSVKYQEVASTFSRYISTFVVKATYTLSLDIA